MREKLEIKNQTWRRFEMTDSRINRMFVVVFFALVLAKLSLGSRSTPLFVVAVLLLLAYALYMGSITKAVLASATTILSASFLISVFKPFSYILLNPFPFLSVFVILGIACTAIFKSSIAHEVKLKTEIFSTSLATMAVILVWDPKLALTSGPVAAIYGSEDNAAWILSIHRVLQNETSRSGGEFGSLIDSMLLVSYHLGSFSLPSLSAIDHLALSVIILQIIVVFFIPFFPSLIRLKSDSGSSAIVSSLVLSLILLICFRSFNQYGHLSTALSCLLLSVYLVVSFQLSDGVDNEKRMQFYIYFQLMVAYLAGVTWFPVAPLSIALLAFTVFRLLAQENISRNMKITFFFLAVVLMLLLVYQDLLRRFDFFQTPGSGPVSGAKNLLSFEGGVVSNDPWNLGLVVVFSFIVMTLMVMLRLKINMYLAEFCLLVAYSMFLTLISTILFSGSVTYGARKVTVLVIFCGAALLAWAIVALVESSMSKFVSPVLPGVLVLSLVLAMPGAGAFGGGKYFAGFEREDYQEQSKQLVNNIEIGRPTVCFFEVTGEQDPGLGGPSYFCSRWAAAYSFTDDGDAFNEWRKAVLGQIPSEDLIGVREGLPSNTMLIVLGPENPQRELNNENWVKLVDKEWTIVR